MNGKWEGIAIAQSVQQFLEENPFKEESGQRYQYFLMAAKPELYKTISEFAFEKMELLPPERQAAIARDIERVQAANDAQKLADCFGRVDTGAKLALYDAAFEYEAEIAPILLRTLERTVNEGRIEDIIYFLFRCQRDYTPELLEMYDRVRSPYAQSLICLFAGFRVGEDRVEWLMEQYTFFLRWYPNESHEQGPLLAIGELQSRFELK